MLYTSVQYTGCDVNGVVLVMLPGAVSYDTALAQHAIS